MSDSLRPEGLPGFTPSTQQARDSALLRATTELFSQEVVHDRDAIRRYEEIASHLLLKVAPIDRLYVAERLATRMDAPLSIMRALAKDRIEVAEVVLTRSPVLGPLDLLTIIAATGPEHHRLIASRPGISSEVLRALRISGDSGLVGLLDAMEDSLGIVKRPILPASAAAPAAPAAPPPEAASPSPPPVTAEAPVAPPAPSDEKPARPAGWFNHRQPFPFRMGRFDPDHFLRLDRPGRLRIMAALATGTSAKRADAKPGENLNQAFRSILGAAQIVGFARSGQRQAIVDAIASGLGVGRDLAASSLDDVTGEPLAVLLKALGLDNSQAQQVFLLATKTVGTDVAAFFKVCDIYAAMEPIVAETLVESWRDTGRNPGWRHEPLFAENAERRRGAAVEQPARDRQAPGIQRPDRASG